MRSAILDSAADLSRIMGKDPESPDADLAHVLAMVLFENREARNPAVRFTRRAKDGEFDDMSDDEYHAALEKVETVSRAWGGRNDARVYELVRNALTDLDVAKLAEAWAPDDPDMAAPAVHEGSMRERIMDTLEGALRDRAGMIGTAASLAIPGVELQGTDAGVLAELLRAALFDREELPYPDDAALAGADARHLADAAWGRRKSAKPFELIRSIVLRLDSDQELPKHALH